MLVAARRKLIDAARQSRVQAEALPQLLKITHEASEMAETGTVFPDERLKLLFVCAHPAIDTAVRTPLMLHAVLGLDAARLASAFLVQPAAIGQRHSRAKSKIRVAGVRFELPEATELPERIEFVLEAIYAAYGSGWDDVAGADPRRKGLAAEAIDLGRLLVQLMPTEPEAKGLLALMLHCESRREARRTTEGAYVPVQQQDVSRWSIELLEEAESWLHEAAYAGKAGRFQLEAAIQSVHAQRIKGRSTDWAAIALLYNGLVHLSPTLGATVGQAAAASEAQNVAGGWELLESIPKDAVQTYQPYWALAAHILTQMGRAVEAGAAYTKAIGLCEDTSMREFLAQKLEKLKKKIP